MPWRFFGLPSVALNSWTPLQIESLVAVGALFRPTPHLALPEPMD
jgi:hypothetical protein